MCYESARLASDRAESKDEDCRIAGSSHSVSILDEHPGGLAVDRSAVGDPAVVDRHVWGQVGSACCYWNRSGTQCSHLAQGKPLFEPGGSACRYWNGYGAQCSHPAQGKPLFV